MARRLKELEGHSSVKPGEEKEVKWTHSHLGDEFHSHDYDINVRLLLTRSQITPELTETSLPKTPLKVYDTVEKLRSW